MWGRVNSHGEMTILAQPRGHGQHQTVINHDSIFPGPAAMEVALDLGGLSPDKTKQTSKK